MKISFISVILAMVMYVPGTYLGSGLPTLHLADLVIMASALYTINTNPSGVWGLLFPAYAKRFILIYSLFLTSFWFSTLINAASEPALDTEFMAALLKLLSMFRPLVFFVIFSATLRQKWQAQHVVSFVMILFIAQALVLVSQSYNLANINDWLTPRYSLVIESSIYSLQGLRTDGTFGNPNDAAVAMIIPASLAASFSLFANVRASRRVLAYVLALLFLLVNIVICKSRTGTAGMLAVFIFLFILSQVNVKSCVAGLIFGLFLILALAVGWIYISKATLGERFIALAGQDNLLADQSLVERVGMWQTGLGDVNGLGIITGQGFAAYIRIGFFDGGYMAYFYTGGILSVVLFVLMSLTVLWTCTTAHLRGKRDASSHICAASAALSFGSLVTTVSHPILYNDRLWLFYMLVFSLGLFSASAPAIKRVLRQQNTY